MLPVQSSQISIQCWRLAEHLERAVLQVAIMYESHMAHEQSALLKRHMRLLGFSGKCWQKVLSGAKIGHQVCLHRLATFQNAILCFLFPQHVHFGIPKLTA